MDVHRPALSSAGRRWALVALPLGFLAVFFVWPLVSIVATGLVADDRTVVAPFVDALTDGDILGVLWFTLWQAAASTLLTLVVAMPGAYVVARYRFRGRWLVRALATVPFVLPTIVVGTAFLALLGPSGALGIDLSGTVAAILIAHVFFNYAVVLRTVGGLWSHLDRGPEEAAKSLGAPPWRVFVSVTLPLLRPAIEAAAAIVFLFTFTSFGIVLILGGAGMATLDVEIFQRTTALFDLPTAAALATIQVIGVTALLVGYSRRQRRRSIELDLRPSPAVARRPTGWRQRLTVTSTLASMALLLGTPLVLLAWRSLTVGGGPDLDAYRALGDDAGIVDPMAALGNSLRFGVIATVIAVVVGLAAAIVLADRRRPPSPWFDALLMLPLGTSAVTVGFGFLVALDSPIDLRASAALIPIAHALVAIPFVVRTTLPVIQAVRTQLHEAAAVLGATPRRVWREIDLPIMTRATAVGAAMAFAVSLGEFGATVFVARPDAPTLPVAIYRFLGRPGELSLGRSLAMSVILMAVTVVAVAAVERLRPAGRSEF